MMSSASSPPSTIIYSLIPSRTQNCPCPHKPSPWSSSSTFIPRLCSSSDLISVNHTRVFPNTSFRCNSSTRPGAPSPGDGDNRSVLDAFFLGKALAETLNERIESTVGEFLSALGKLQAEQQKQLQDFQVEVLERAKSTKERAAREAMEAQGLVPKPSTTNVPAVTNSDVTANSPSATDAVTPTISPPSYGSSTPTINTESDPTDKDPLLGISNED